MYTNETLKKYYKLMNAKVAELMQQDVNTFKVTISNGNRKIGRVMNVSTPAGLTCGNCSHCLGYCYDIKANFVYSNTVLPARAKNFVIVMKNRDMFFQQIEDKISRRKANKFFRWHVAGEILDLDYFSRMVGIAKRHPDFIFWTYTKMYTIVNQYCDTNGRAAIPANFRIMFSEWDGMPLVNPYNFPIFTCKLKDGNKNHTADFFNTLYKCPGNCDICKECGRGCLAGESTYADEH